MTNVESGGLYPEWLSQGLLTGDLPWDKGQTVSMTAFLATYTLHDSYWIGVWAEPGEMPIAVIRWDAFWSDGRIPYPSDHVRQWPILLIAFTGATQLLISSPRSEYPYSGIESATSNLVSAAERNALLDLAIGHTDMDDAQLEYLLDPSLHHTIITAVTRHQVHVFHEAEVTVLCSDHEGHVIPIPDL